MKVMWIIGVLALLGLASANAQVAVIVNKSVGTGSATAGQIADIFSLNTKEWADGSKIVVFDLKAEGAVKEKFHAFIGKSSSDLKKIWMRLQLSGEGKAPEGLGSEEEVVAKVASTPGAIGFVGAGKAGGNVKVIATIN